MLGLLAMAGVPRHARSQAAARTVRVGYLSLPTRDSVEPVLQVFLRALRDLGWIEGRNLVIEYRWANGNAALLPDLAMDLVREKVDVIVAPAAGAALAAKNATRTIPIVMIFPADPVALGLVQSLNQPGGNVTGTSYAHDSAIFRKQLQILGEVVPRASRVAILASPADPLRAIQHREFDAAARAMHVRLHYVEARGEEDFAPAFAAMARERAQALLVAGSSAYFTYREQLGGFVARSRLPTMYTLREMVESAGLLSYAANLSDFIGRSAGYVDKLLKGADPAALAVAQPEKFDLVVNLRTAKELGLTIPASVLQRADEIIQ